MKNVTVSLDDDTAVGARQLAAEQNVSLSRLIGQLLEQHLKESRDYARAMRRYLARTPVVLNQAGVPYPLRDTLHDRSGLR